MVPVAILGLSAAIRTQDDLARSAQQAEIDRLIASIEERETTLKGLRLTMSTSGSYPGGVTFHTRGTLRVLGTTHYHLRLEASFGGPGGPDEIRSLTEQVGTPEGLWSHQRGPVEDVYTVMDRDLMERLQTARRELAKEKGSGAAVLRPLDDTAHPLGSAALTALSQQFHLTVKPGTVRAADGTQCRAIEGDWRGVATDVEQPPEVARVEVLLRESDDIPVRIVHWGKPEGEDTGVPLLEIVLTDIEIDPSDLDEASFVLDVEEGRKTIPVMDHRPSKAQIQRLLDEFAALQRDKKVPN